MAICTVVGKYDLTGGGGRIGSKGEKIVEASAKTVLTLF
jgi:hypothetical protein